MDGLAGVEWIERLNKRQPPAQYLVETADTAMHPHFADAPGNHDQAQRAVLQLLRRDLRAGNESRLGQRTVHPVANAADNANRLIAALAGRQIGQQRAQGRGDIRAARGLEADMGKLYANGRIFQRARLFRHGLVRPDGNFRTRPFDGKHGRGNDIARGLST